MAKWIYVAHMGEDNPICRDIGNIEKLTLDSTGRTTNALESLVADGIQYYLGMQPYAIRILGMVSLDSMYDAKTGEQLTWVYPPLENAKDGMVVDVKHKPSSEIYTHSAYCDDPRLLCILNRLLNLLLRNEDSDSEKVDKALIVPTREEALKYLREREYTPSCISDAMKNHYYETRPGWEDRMYNSD